MEKINPFIWKTWILGVVFQRQKTNPAGNQRTKRVKYPEWINFADIGYSETVEEQD